MTLIQKIILFISLSRLHPTNMKYIIKAWVNRITQVRMCAQA